MEKQVKVETYGVIQICEDCKVGHMEYVKDDTLVYRPGIEHKCEHCGAVKYFEIIYPAIKHRIKRGESYE